MTGNPPYLLRVVELVPGTATAAWEPELVSQVSAPVQSRFRRDRWENNVAWRDQALMALDRCWRDRPLLAGPPEGMRCSRP